MNNYAFFITKLNNADGAHKCKEGQTASALKQALRPGRERTIPGGQKVINTPAASAEGDAPVPEMVEGPPTEAAVPL